MTPRLTSAVVLSAVVAASAGCGGGGKPPSVASLGTASNGPASSGGTPLVPNGGSFVKFVNCLRAHGVDAQLGEGGHGVEITGGPPGSPKMSTAQAACRKYLPGGELKPATPEQREKETKYLVKLAKCMRAHGVPDFPDPNPNGAPPFDITKVDTETPQFRSAARACGATGPNGQGFAIRVRA